MPIAAGFCVFRKAVTLPMPTLNLSSPRPKWIPERVAHGRRVVSNYEFYNKRAWRKVAKLHKQLNPLCVMCEQAGRITPATVTDHPIPINEGGSKWDWDNLQSLCDRCHAIKSATEGRNRDKK